VSAALESYGVYKCARFVCRRRASQRRGSSAYDDGLCSICRKGAAKKDARHRAAAQRAADPLPDAPCSMTTSETSVILVGEVTRAAWDGVADALAHRIDEPSVVLDLSAVSHARSMPSRAAGYVEAMRARCADVVVRASPYVRACIQASRYGAGLNVRWVAP
jgi:hypothetical protein